jgi:hypothetical protein
MPKSYFVHQYIEIMVEYPCRSSLWRARVVLKKIWRYLMLYNSSSKMAVAACMAGLIVSHVEASYSDPILLGQIEILGSETSSPTVINQDGTVGFVRTRASQAGGFGEKMYAVDLTTSPELTILGSIDIASAGIGSEELHIDGDILYMVPSLTLVDISDPENMAIVGSFSDVSPIRDAAVSGTTLYAQEGARRVGIYDCSDPTVPVYVGNIALPLSNPISSIESWGADKLLVGRGFGGMQVLDVSTLGELPVVGLLSGIRVEYLTSIADTAYTVSFAGGEAVLTSVDLGDPVNPLVLGQYVWSNLSLFENSGALSGFGPDHIALYLEYGAIEVINVSDPTTLSPIEPIVTESEMPSAVAADMVLLTTRTGLELYQIASVGECASDLNGDGELNFFDVSAFLAAFASMDPVADFTGDGNFNFFDVSAFLSAFAAGCP